ncbi:hypothetical protein AB0J43_04085 [Nonomuraea fuscirosea]
MNTIPPSAEPAPAEQLPAGHAPAEPASAEPASVLLAVRLERQWVTQPGRHGIVVHGRTLRDLHASAQQALALRLGASTPPPVQVCPHSPELDALAHARRRYQDALRAAVQKLRGDKVYWTDVAQACHVRIATAQDVLNDEAENGS